MPADPKDGKRIIDPDAIRRARALGDECAACGGPPVSVHHVIQRGAPYFGDDVVENLLLLCGTGTTGCHGAWHGSPYTFTFMPLAPLDRPPTRERRDREWVAVRIGNFIHRQRPDTLQYVVKKLGLDAAAVFLWDNYRITELTTRRVAALELAP